MAVIGLLVFAAGSVVAGLAPTAAVLVAGRALQGAGAATLDPALLALLVTEFPEGPERNRALGIWSAAGSLGIPAGALLGGLLTAALGWRWVLLAAAPVALVAAGLVRAALGREPRPGDTPALRPARRRWCASRSCAAPGCWPPTWPPPPCRSGSGPCCSWARCTSSGCSASPPWRRASPTWCCRCPWSWPARPPPSWSARYGRRAVAAGGLLLQAAGLLLLLGAGPGGSFLTGVAPGFLLVGAGAPIAWVPLTAAAVDGAGEQSGSASGLFNTAQQVGNAVALAVLATVAAARASGLAGGGPPTRADLVAGFHAGFLAAAALCLLGLLAALRLPRPPARPPLTVPTPRAGRPGPARRRTRSPRGHAGR